jgi:hypothetical protein
MINIVSVSTLKDLCLVYRSCIRLIYMLAKRTHSAEQLIKVYTHATGRITQCSFKSCVLLYKVNNIVTVTRLKGLCLVCRSCVRLMYVFAKRTHSAQQLIKVYTHATGRITQCTVNDKHMDNLSTLSTLKGLCLVYRSCVRLIFMLAKRTHSAE